MTVRAMDFGLPGAWVAQPKQFLVKPCEEKRAMIGELRQPVTGEMVMREITRYADPEFRCADTSDEGAIEGMVRMDMARKQYLGGGMRCSM